MKCKNCGNEAEFEFCSEQCAREYEVCECGFHHPGNDCPEICERCGGPVNGMMTKTDGTVDWCTCQ